MLNLGSEFCGLYTHFVAIYIYMLTKSYFNYAVIQNGGRGNKSHKYLRVQEKGLTQDQKHDCSLL